MTIAIAIGWSGPTSAQAPPPNTARPGQPGATHPDATQPGATQPGATHPGATHPAAAQPGQPNTAPPRQPSAAPPVAANPRKRRPWQLHLGLGFGDAVCDNEKPDSDCPVDGAFTLALGASWRFHRRFSLGLELAVWGYKIREDWRGQLDDDATDVSFSSFYLAPHVRWHWLLGASAKPYLQAGIGLGSVTAEASNDTGTYEYSASGVVIPLAIGVEWRIGKRFRIGPQAQAYLQISNEICADEPNLAKDCRSPGTNDDGDREGLLLPWRIMVMGSYSL